MRQIAAVNRRTATTEQRAKLHRLGDDAALVTMTTSEGDVFDVAASADAYDGLFGPISTTTYNQVVEQVPQQSSRAQ